MDVWPPPPTSNAAPPPENAPPRRRLVTRFVWLDVVLGVLAGLITWPVASVLCCIAVLFLIFSGHDALPFIVTCWVNLGLTALMYGLLCRKYPSLSVGALAVTVLVWLPVVIFVLPDWFATF